jgi:hypothetical protein
MTIYEVTCDGATRLVRAATPTQAIEKLIEFWGEDVARIRDRSTYTNEVDREETRWIVKFRGREKTSTTIFAVEADILQ